MKLVKQESAYNYVLRWRPSETESRRPLYIGGYGVELALKSTEYKATDDQKIESSTASDESSSSSVIADGEDLVIQGYDFPALKAQHPDKSNSLTDFQAHIVRDYSDTFRIRPMKSYELKGL